MILIGSAWLGSAIWWLVALAIALHNLEEIAWLPGWMERHDSFIQWEVEAGHFRYIAGLLTVVPFLLAGWLELLGVGSIAHYGLAAYAIGQSLNILMPHMAASLATGSYMPGLGSGLLLVIPMTLAFVWPSIKLGQLRPIPLMLSSLILIPLVLLALPRLFRLAEILSSRHQD